MTTPRQTALDAVRHLLSAHEGLSEHGERWDDLHAAVRWLESLPDEIRLDIHGRVMHDDEALVRAFMQGAEHGWSKCVSDDEAIPDDEAEARRLLADGVLGKATT